MVDTASVDWHANSLGNSFKELGTTFGAAFGAEGLQSLFSDSSKIPQVLMTIIPSVYQIRLIQLEHLSVRDVEQGFSLKKMN